MWGIVLLPMRLAAPRRNGGSFWTKRWRWRTGFQPGANNCLADNPMPTSHYSVIQYVPDLAAGEFVNVGLLVFQGDGPPLVRCLRSWDRVEQFSGVDISPVREFVHKLEAGSGPVASLADARRLSESWHSVVQVT